MRWIFFLLLFLLVPLAHAEFQVNSYDAKAILMQDGSLSIHETIKYETDVHPDEMFYSIPDEYYSDLSDIQVNSIFVNGEETNYTIYDYEELVGIVWPGVPRGENTVEINYSLKNRAVEYDDYILACWSHFASGRAGDSTHMFDFLFALYYTEEDMVEYKINDSKEGTINVYDKGVKGEYTFLKFPDHVSGCYIFEKGGVNASRHESGSALDALEEADMSRNRTFTPFHRDKLELFCLPILLISFISAYIMYKREKKRPHLAENILPPGSEEPAVVAALVKNDFRFDDLVAATILDLISKGIIGIVELEKDPANVDPDKEHTILFLKKKNAKVKDHERTLLDFIFSEGDKVDLDKRLEDYKKSYFNAPNKLIKPLNKFNREFWPQVQKLLENNGVYKMFLDGERRRDDIRKAFSFGMLLSLGIGMVMTIIMNQPMPAIVGELLVMGIITLWGSTFLLSFLADVVFIQTKARRISKSELMIWGLYSLVFFVFPFNIMLSGIGNNLMFVFFERISIWIPIIVIASAILSQVFFVYSAMMYIKPKIPKNRLDEYAKWEAFHRALKSSRIDEYPPSSAHIWNDILTYATALGEAKRVGRNLSELEYPFARDVDRIFNYGKRSDKRSRLKFS
jgi:hypothetical protein